MHQLSRMQKIFILYLSATPSNNGRFIIWDGENPTHPTPNSNTPTMPLLPPTTIYPPCQLARGHGWNHTMDTSLANWQISPRTRTTSPPTMLPMMSIILKRTILTNSPKVVITSTPNDRPAHVIPPLQQDQAQSHVQSTVYW
jgi:hypothetical protein